MAASAVGDSEAAGGALRPFLVAVKTVTALEPHMVLSHQAHIAYDRKKIVSFEAALSVGH